MVADTVEELDQKLVDEFTAFLREFAVGRWNRWSRQALASHFGIGDRYLRRLLAAVQLRGVRVVPDYSTEPDDAPLGGYYIAKTAEPVWAAYEQHRKRLVSHARSMKALRGALPELPEFGQQVLDLVGGAPGAADSPEGWAGRHPECAGCENDPSECVDCELRDEARTMGAGRPTGNADDRPEVT